MMEAHQCQSFSGPGVFWKLFGPKTGWELAEPGISTQRAGSPSRRCLMASEAAFSLSKGALFDRGTCSKDAATNLRSASASAHRVLSGPWYVWHILVNRKRAPQAFFEWRRALLRTCPILRVSTQALVERGARCASRVRAEARPAAAPRVAAMAPTWQSLTGHDNPASCQRLAPI